MSAFAFKGTGTTPQVPNKLKPKSIEHQHDDALLRSLGQRWHG
jgi:hypothetical protein